MIKSIKRFFVSVFQKRQQRKTEVIISKTKRPTELKWGLVVPHEKNKPGATSWDKKESEYIYWQVVFHWIEAKYRKIPIAFRDVVGLSGAYKSLWMRSVNASIEPHYNAYNGVAHGFECLVLEGDDLSAEYALRLRDVFLKHFPNRAIRAREGIKFVKSGENGALNLIRAKEQGMAVCILPECFFGDNKKDYITHEKMAQILNEFIDTAS